MAEPARVDRGLHLARQSATGDDEHAIVLHSSGPGGGQLLRQNGSFLEALGASG
jgi:hypothetical protein